jgi:hypothetical protein
MPSVEAFPRSRSEKIQANRKINFPDFSTRELSRDSARESQFSCAVPKGCTRVITSTKYVLVEQALGVSPAFTCQ